MVRGNIKQNTQNYVASRLVLRRTSRLRVALLLLKLSSSFLGLTLHFHTIISSLPCIANTALKDDRIQTRPVTILVDPDALETLLVESDSIKVALIAMHNSVS
eukprot:853839_1